MQQHALAAGGYGDPPSMSLRHCGRAPVTFCLKLPHHPAGSPPLSRTIIITCRISPDGLPLILRMELMGHDTDPVFLESSSNLSQPRHPQTAGYSASD
jgi:hypothetical protein